MKNYLHILSIPIVLSSFLIAACQPPVEPTTTSGIGQGTVQIVAEIHDLAGELELTLSSDDANKFLDGEQVVLEVHSIVDGTSIPFDAEFQGTLLNLFGYTTYQYPDYTLEITAQPANQRCFFRNEGNPLTGTLRIQNTGTFTPGVYCFDNPLPGLAELFPDNGLQKCLLEYFEENSTTDLSSITALECAYNYPEFQYRIKSLSGLGNLPNLQTLVISDSGLIEADLSQNTALTSVNIFSYSLQSLDLSNSILLTDLKLDLDQSRLGTLDLTNNVALTNLDFSSGGVEILDLSGNPNLETLYIEGDYSLTTVNMGGCDSLQTLESRAEYLRQLDISQCTNLSSLYIYEGNLQALDLTNNVQLEYVRLYDASSVITAMDLSQNNQLERLYITDIPLQSIDLGTNSVLRLMRLTNTELTTINLDAQTALQEFWFTGTPLDEATIAYILSLGIDEVVY